MKMKKENSVVRFIVLVLASSLQLSAQQAPPSSHAFQPPDPATGKLEFDVASVRLNKSGDPEAGGDRSSLNVPRGPDDGYRPTGGVFTGKNYPLIFYVQFAYRITTSQSPVFRASMPAWVMTENYDIQAKTDNHDVTKDELRLMMRSLLADRFKLVAHTETREVSISAAVLAKPGVTGPHLRPHTENPPCPVATAPAAISPTEAPATPPPTTTPVGFPLGCNGFAVMQPLAPFHRHEGARNMTIAQVVSSFSGLGSLGHPVLDQTGLSGAYDFDIDFLPQPSPGTELPVDAAGPAFRDAVKDQLGLKLESQKAPVDYVVVDHIEHPSANE
jgi:uncharacterized protein (TIGR03435 family)